MIRDNNKGFSFVELLVVIAIVAVMMTVAIGAMSYLNRTNAKKAISTVQSTMTLVRNKSIAYKNPWKCQIEMDASGRCNICVYEKKGPGNLDWVKFSETSLGNIQNIQLSVAEDTNPPALNRGTAGTLEFYFKNSTGAFDMITRPNDSAEEPTKAKDVMESGKSFATLDLTTTANNSAKIKLYFVSGKVEIV